MLSVQPDPDPAALFTPPRAYVLNGGILAVDQADGEFADAFARPSDAFGLAGEDEAKEFGTFAEGCGWRAFASTERIPGQYSAQGRENIESEQYFCCFSIGPTGRMQPKGAPANESSPQPIMRRVVKSPGRK